MAQDETRVITFFFFFCQFLGISTPENKYMEIVRALVVPLAPDATSDNQFVDKSLSPEHIQPRDSPRFSHLGKADMAHSC